MDIKEKARITYEILKKRKEKQEKHKKEVKKKCDWELVACHVDRFDRIRKKSHRLK